MVYRSGCSRSRLPPTHQAEMRLKLLQTSCTFEDVITHGEARILLLEWLRTVHYDRLLAFRDALEQYQQLEQARARTRRLLIASL